MGVTPLYVPVLLLTHVRGCTEFWTSLSITVLFLWVLYRPDHFHPRVDSTVLSSFRSTSPRR